MNLRLWRHWGQLIGATTLLTRLPVGGLTRHHPPPADCVWAYPLVGGLVGAIGSAILAAGLAIGLPQALAGLWALVATVLVTGGLHEDGLADTADGFGGGRTPERKLAIMRDSRIGSFGAIALLFSLLLRGTALALTPHPVQAILLASVLGRGAMLVPLLLLTPARPEGLASTLGPTPRPSLITGLLLTAAAAPWAPTPALAALAASLLATHIARQQIAGYTGDTLGATEQAAECLSLSLA